MIEPLTATETRWLKKLNKLLAECPSNRLGFFTTGDANLSVYDKTDEAGFDTSIDFPMAVELADALLGFVYFPSNVVATVG